MIKILYFASIKEALGQSEESFALTDKIANVEDLLETLAARDNHWQHTLQDQKVLVAVNQEVCGNNQTLKTGDEVAFFPPVTGG